MSTEFEKELTRILVDVYRIGWNDNGAKQYPTSISSIAQAIEESKQAIGKHLIAEPMAVSPDEDTKAEWYRIGHNNLVVREREALWGDKQIDTRTLTKDEKEVLDDNLLELL